MERIAHRTRQWLVIGLSFASISLFQTAFADIRAPYSLDAHTLHLWHLDEAGAPAVDSVVGGGTNLVGLLNGATLGTASFAGFGNALNTIDGGADAITAGTRDALITPSTAATPGNITTLYASQANGAFTYEAIVRVDFDPAKNFGTVPNGGNGRNTTFMILSGESTATANRIFQFRILPIGISGATVPTLSFENVRQASAAQSIAAAIPTTGPDAIELSGWYHVAVAYNGVPNTAGNINFYWTRVDANRVSANKVDITSATTMCSGLLPANNGATPLVIGNEGRNRTSNFIGLVDEVRISSIARSAGDMLFTSPMPVIISEPSDVTVAAGQSATFTVTAGGAGQLGYQWRYEGDPIGGATQTAYTISSVTISNAGSYDVVVTNGTSSVTSTSALLTVRNPLSLNWTGTFGFDWDFVTENWINSSNSANATYGIGDHVRFDGTGAGFVNLTAPLTPSSVTVDSSADYSFVTFNGGMLAGDSDLIKNGSGKLILETDHNYDGSTTISAGTIEVGANTNAGSLGKGPIINNGALVFNRTGSLIMGNNISGNGSLTIEKNVGITFTGTNSFSGNVLLNAGALFLFGNEAGVNPGTITLNATPNNSGFGGTRLSMGGGVTVSGTFNLLGSSAAPDLRCTVANFAGTNFLTGPITLGGNGPIQFWSESTPGEMIVNGPITGGSYTGGLTIRGAGNGSLNSIVNLPNGNVNKTDGGIWTIKSTGNVWTNSNVSVGTLRVGANNALPTGVSITMGQAGASTCVLDLGGFNQTIGALREGGGGIAFIGNSSTNSDSTLTLTTTETLSFGGRMQDVIGTNGTRKLSFTLNGGSLTLRSNNTYTGDTLIQSGSLNLSGEGLISGSANLILNSGATLNASARNDGTLTLSPNQTLKGNGNLNVTGILSSSGTIELKVNKAGSIAADKVSGTTQIIYGGTLKLALSGNALADGDSIKLFDAASYSGAFLSFNPAIPGPGLLWDTTTLAADGILRVTTGTLTYPTFSSTAIVGSDIVMGGSGGTPGAGYTVLSSTNVALPLVNWTVVKTGSFDGSGNFSETIAMTPGAPRFYLLRLP